MLVFLVVLVSVCLFVVLLLGSTLRRLYRLMAYLASLAFVPRCRTHWQRLVFACYLQVSFLAFVLGGSPSRLCLRLCLPYVSPLLPLKVLLLRESLV